MEGGRRRAFAGFAVLAFNALTFGACGGGESSPPGPNGALRVAGTYTISRSYISNTCNPEIPGATATVTGTVSHEPGATHFFLANSDGGNFDAQVAADGTFSSGVQHREGADRIPYDLLFEGRFSTTGFRGTLTGDIFRPGGACRSVLDWQAVKQGSPNVLG